MSCPICTSENVKKLESKALDLGLWRSAVVASFVDYICLHCGFSYQERIPATEICTPQTVTGNK